MIVSTAELGNNGHGVQAVLRNQLTVERCVDVSGGDADLGNGDAADVHTAFVPVARDVLTGVCGKQLLERPGGCLELLLGWILVDIDVSACGCPFCALCHDLEPRPIAKASAASGRCARRPEGQVPQGSGR